MFSLRLAAGRALSSRSISIAVRPRSISTFPSNLTRPTRVVASVQFQRRWVTNEAEVKKEDQEVPVSHLQPTPQEEVENAIADSSKWNQVTEQRKPTVSDTNATAGLTEDLEETSPIDKRRPLRDPPTPKSTIYVGNLFFDVTENDLTKEFQRFGEVKQVRLIRDARGLSKGFGYIQFESTEVAQAVVNDMNQQLFEGRRLSVSFAHSEERPTGSRDREHKPINPPSKTLFIGNMSFEMTDRDLNNLFRGVRNVIDVRVAIDRRTGQPRGFAHADFVDVKSAMEAMKHLSNQENYGRKLRIDYSYGPSTAPRNTPA